MKKNLVSIIKKLLIIGVVFILFNSCTEEKYYYIDPEGEFGYVYTAHLDIDKDEWIWNNNNEWYEVYISFSEIANHISNWSNIYEWGVIDASVFIFENNIERLEKLPYNRTWYEDTTGEYTETIRFAPSMDKNGIYFYIQASDLGRDDSVVPQDYTFKISLIYNFVY